MCGPSRRLRSCIESFFGSATIQLRSRRDDSHNLCVGHLAGHLVVSLFEKRSIPLLSSVKFKFQRLISTLVQQVSFLAMTEVTDQSSPNGEHQVDNHHDNIDDSLDNHNGDDDDDVQDGDDDEGIDETLIVHYKSHLFR